MKNMADFFLILKDSNVRYVCINPSREGVSNLSDTSTGLNTKFLVDNIASFIRSGIAISKVIGDKYKLTFQSGDNKSEMYIYVFARGSSTLTSIIEANALDRRVLRNDDVYVPDSNTAFLIGLYRLTTAKKELSQILNDFELNSLLEGIKLRVGVSQSKTQ